MIKRVIWPEPVQKKLFSYTSKHFSNEETRDFLMSIVLQADEILLNPIVSKTYTEEYGDYQGVSRIVVEKFKIYYSRVFEDIVILGIKFPGEDK